MNRSESITKISAALVIAQRAMAGAYKDAKNPFYKSNFASLNAVREAVTPALNSNGITVLQPMKFDANGRTIIETVLLHESGEFISSETPVIVSKANDPQAEGSGQSYARRYGLQSLLSVGTTDDDGEAAMGRTEKPATQTKDQATPAKFEPVAAVVTKVDTVKKTVSISTDPAVVATTPTESPKKTSSFKRPTTPAPKAEEINKGWK